MIEPQTPPTAPEPVLSSTSPGGRTFGEWLSIQLKARKLSQRQLAERSGVDHSTISRLLRGSRVPSLRTANRLAHSLGMADGLDGLDRRSHGNTRSPVARVEYALRLDELLSDAQVREIMNLYLSIRWRHRA
jgi:transcriptional regulator with XRE-family HTH domain